nr:MAG TPA: hypothetical protein [Caudoviricetes sp.]
MDNKDLITRFAEDCFRFEALHQEIDSLIADEVNEVLIYEYEDLANQAAEIVLKLSANGNNLGLNFYRYYVERLEYIIDYFRALLDYEETPLAEDEPNELDDATPAEFYFEGFPTGCAFPKKPDFVIKKWAFTFTPTAKNEANAAADEADAVEEDDSEDEQPGELDDENDTQAAESDEPSDEESEPLPEMLGWDALPPEDQGRVRETLDMWYEMNVITGRYGGGDKVLPSAENLMRGVGFRGALVENVASGSATEILAGEIKVRRIIWEAIYDIPGFRDSEKFKELIERYPTYKEKEQ